MTTDPVLYLTEIDVHDGVSATTHRFSNFGFTTKPSETPSNTPYAPTLLQPVTVGRNIFRGGGATSGRGETANGRLVLANGDGALDAIFVTGAIDGRSIVVRQGLIGAAYPSGFTTVFRGTMLGQAEMDQDTVTIQVRGREQELEVPLTTTLYAGDNALPVGLEGGAELAGKPKPVCYGTVRNVSPVCVNTSKLIYQVHDGAIEDIPDVYDSGITLGGLATWTALTSGFGSPLILGMAYGNGVWVIAGESGTLYSSSDSGATWTSRTSGFGADTIRSVSWLNDSLFIATGDNGKVSTSPDGVTWTARTSTFGTDTVAGASYIPAGGLYVIVGDAGKLASSPDGATWTSRTSGFAGTAISGVAYGRGTLVAVGANKFSTSPDGTTWTIGTTTITGGVSFKSIVFGSGLFVAGMTDARMANAFDGRAWNLVPTIYPATTAVYGLAYGQGAFIACAGSSGAATSQDGTLWTLLTAAGLVTYAAAFGRGRFMAGGGNGFGANALGISTPRESDYTSLADLSDDALAPEPGSYKVFPDEGYFRIGSPPAGVITCDVYEGATAADRTTGQLFKRILEDRASLSSGTDFNATDITTLDAAADYESGYWTADQVSISDVLDKVTASAGAWWMPDRTGIYRIRQLVAPSGTPVVALVADSIKGRLAKRTNTDPAAGLPAWKVVVYYSPNYTVQTNGVAGGVDDDRRALLAQPYKSVEVEDPDVQRKFVLAPTLNVYTLIANDIDAQLEGIRLLELRKVQRDRFPVPVEATTANTAVEAGDVVSLTHDRFGLSFGPKFVVVGVLPNAAERSISLELWGGGRNRLYHIDDGAGGLKLSTVPLPQGIFIDNGAGGLKLSEDLTQTEAAYYLSQDDGTYALTAA